MEMLKAASGALSAVSLSLSAADEPLDESTSDGAPSELLEMSEGDDDEVVGV